MINRRSAVRLLLVVVLFLAIVMAVDIPAAFALWKQADWRWLALSILVVQLQLLLSAVRWHITATRLGLHIGMRRAVREYSIATLANLSLPGGVTGDAARIYRTRNAGFTLAAQSVMIERLGGQMALILVALIGWLFWPMAMDSSAPRPGAQLIATVLVLCIVLCIAIWTNRQSTGRTARFIRSFWPALCRVWWQDYQWLPQGVLSLTVVATYLAVFAGCALALQQPLPILSFVSIVPLVLLSMVIPLSIGGWGIREAAAVSLWPLLGLSAEAGLATSVLYGLISLLGTLPGALLIGIKLNKPETGSIVT